MAYVFPTTPQIGTQYQQFIWDGEKWATSGYVTTFIEVFGVNHPDQVFIISHPGNQITESPFG